MHYFSPEQAKGQPVANNADLYSLGIVLYEMLIGRVPFRGDSPISIALQHINEEIEFTQEEKTKIPHSIRTLISKMTEKSPEDRYQSAEEVIEDIDYIEKNIDLDFIKEYDNYVTQKIDQDKLLAKSKRYNTNRNYYEEDLEDYSDEYEDEEDYYEEQKPVRKSNKNNVSKKAKKKKRNNTKKIIIGVIALAVVVVALFGGKLAINAFLNNNTSSNGQVESFDVPNFVGISIDDANKQAAKLGLNIQTTEEYNTEVKAGYIISQSPQMGKVQTGDTINVVVSLGGKAATVPNCVGMSYEKAKKLIESNNLKVGSRSYEYSDSYEEGVVIWQNPSSGTNGVMQNTTVDLVISKGKKPEDNTTKPDDNNQNNSGDNNNSDNSGDNNNSNTDNPGDNNNPNNPGDSGNTDNNGSSGNTESQQNASIRKGDYWV